MLYLIIYIGIVLLIFISGINIFKIKKGNIFYEIDILFMFLMSLIWPISITIYFLSKIYYYFSTTKEEREYNKRCGKILDDFLKHGKEMRSKGWTNYPY